MNRPTDKEIFVFVHELMKDFVTSEETKDAIGVIKHPSIFYVKMMKFSVKLIRFILNEPNWKYGDADKEPDENKT